jgi:hypothetical protein
MSDYQKVEIVQGETEAFSEQDIQNLEQEAPQEEQAERVEEQRPQWLPEKFDSPEAMAKAYGELESNYTRDKQASESGEESSEETPKISESLSVESFSPFAEEFDTTGDISNESRTAIEGMGIPREMIDSYIEGQQSLVNSLFDDVYRSVGGEEQYNQMLNWAGENLAPEEQEVFNDAVMGGNSAQMMFAIKSLSSQWQSHTSPRTPLLQGSTGSANAHGGFRSLAELTAAMKDVRYTKDPAYRKEIETRLDNSNIL